MMKKTKIAFLDAGTVQYGDISLKPLEKLGSFKSYHSTTSAQMEQRLRGIDFAVFNKCKFPRALIEKLPQLKGLFITATGTDVVDLQAAQEKGIAVSNVPGYSTDTVAQSTIGLIIALAWNLIPYQQAAKDGSWSRSPFFVYGSYPIRELKGKKLGILGYGAIGSAVARTARALGMEILVSAIPGRKYPKKERIKRYSFDFVVRRADFLTIHTPLTPLTRGLINSKVLRKMKADACLINMARGGIVNEADLRKVLESGHLSGAATDVLTQEPPPRNHILLKAPRLLITPHVSWASLEVRTRLIGEVAENIKAYLKGKKRNRVV